MTTRARKTSRTTNSQNTRTPRDTQVTQIAPGNTPVVTPDPVLQGMQAAPQRAEPSKMASQLQRPSRPTPKLETYQTPAERALPMPPPPAFAGVYLPDNVLAELRAGTELLAELLAKATAATATQIVKRELDAITRAAAAGQLGRDALDGAWAGKLVAENPTPDKPAALRARGSAPPPNTQGGLIAGQTHAGRKADLNDPRLAGLTMLRRVFNNWEIVVSIKADGFEWGGKVWPSLSAIARAVTGTRRNGYEFFELGEHAKH